MGGPFAGEEEIGQVKRGEPAVQVGISRVKKRTYTIVFMLSDPVWGDQQNALQATQASLQIVAHQIFDPSRPPRAVLRQLLLEFMEREPPVDG